MSFGPLLLLLASPLLAQERFIHPLPLEAADAHRRPLQRRPAPSCLHLPPNPLARQNTALILSLEAVAGAPRPGAHQLGEAWRAYFQRRGFGRVQHLRDEDLLELGGISGLYDALSPCGALYFIFIGRADIGPGGPGLRLPGGRLALTEGRFFEILLRAPRAFALVDAPLLVPSSLPWPLFKINDVTLILDHPASRPPLQGPEALSALGLKALEGCADEDGDRRITAEELWTALNKGRVASGISSIRFGGEPGWVLAGPPRLSRSKINPSPIPLGWLSVEGGSFTMGDLSSPETSPARLVELPPFEITRAEITVAQYRACVDARACPPPRAAALGAGEAGRYLNPSRSPWRRSAGACNWGRFGVEAHPINCITWAQAQAFARWAGARLPSEAELEYAQRFADIQGHPDAPFEALLEGALAQPSCAHHVMDDGLEALRYAGCGRDGTSRVCSKTDDPFAPCDLLGNVAEWTADAYHHDYSQSPCDGRPNRRARLPDLRVVRGGGWMDVASSLEARRRGAQEASTPSPNIGFRLAR